jgi:Tol biopolymer transport system component
LGYVLFTAGSSILNQTLYIHQIDLKSFKDTPITDDYDASYSKDCTKIIYTKPNDGSKAIYIYDLTSNGSGSSGTKVISTNLSWANIQHPKLSPDGNHILFEADSTYQVKESLLK